MEAENIKELASLFYLRGDLVEQAKGFLHRRERALGPKEATIILKENARSLSFPDHPELEREAEAEIRRYGAELRRRSGGRVKV